MDKLIIGILAHVDAGKTTLSEALLYERGALARLGRVDHGDAFLDTYSLERQRGITIFSKQAVFQTDNFEITLLDTPGHVDFSAETERTLSVLDYAILVVSATQGVQSHTKTLMDLLASYHVPVFIFINKMDQTEKTEGALMDEVRSHLDEACVSFSEAQTREVFYESVAMCDEGLMDTYLAYDEIPDEMIGKAITDRVLFPCFFGSALKTEGVTAFLEAFDRLASAVHRGSDFGAAVFKVDRDEKDSRLTHVKITGGTLKVKDTISYRSVQRAGGGATGTAEEKVDQIRIYSGAGYRMAPEAEAGTVCALTGLTDLRPGDGIGSCPAAPLPSLAPILTYSVSPPPGVDTHTLLTDLRLLEEEEPGLHVTMDAATDEIHVRLMGVIQTEILRSIVNERFGMDITFGAGRILYKESIMAPVVGSGHFEPLRHYAEVHLLLEPAPAGSGLSFHTNVRGEVLDKNFQNLVLTHLKEVEHPGVLTGAPITDMKITLIGGRSHIKHTEGGDFREATYRALRQGLFKADSVLLEPAYSFRIEVPSELIGRAMTDMQKAEAVFGAPVLSGAYSVLTGEAPAALIMEYPITFQSYTRGRGRLALRFAGYRPCHNAEEIIADTAYNAEGDTLHPASSVFCSHGSGTVVAWNEADAHMHALPEHALPADGGDQTGADRAVPGAKKPQASDDSMGGSSAGNARGKESTTAGNAASRTDRNKRYTGGSPASETFAGKTFAGETFASDRELKEIFERTFGPVKRDALYARKAAPSPRLRSTDPAPARGPSSPAVMEYLLVDGYNIIFAWEDLKSLAAANIDAAREKLIDELSNFRGFRNCEVILVFDAYRIKGHSEEISMYKGLHLVYTKEAETADQYIEKTSKRIAAKYHTTVATSDHLEQIIVFGSGASLISARELEKLIAVTRQEIREASAAAKDKDARNYLLSHADEKLAAELEKIRRGKK